MNYSLDSKKGWQKVLRPLVRQKKQERDSLTYHEDDTINSFLVFFAILMAGIVILISSCDQAHAAIADDKAVLAIIGEAENQGYDGMLAVACALRNRGTLGGVYGYNSVRVRERKFSKAIYAQAVRAWEKSKDCDVTHGSTHWENIKAFGKPYWVKSMVLCYEVKDHRFYREVR